MSEHDVEACQSGRMSFKRYYVGNLALNGRRTESTKASLMPAVIGVDLLILCLLSGENMPAVSLIHSVTGSLDAG